MGCLDFLRKPVGPYRVGTVVAMVALFFQTLAMVGQLYSLIDWECAITAKLQTDTFKGNDAARARARLDYGTAIADMIWIFPLNILAWVGLLARLPFGYGTTLMELSLGVYWPVVYAAQRWGKKNLATIIVTLVLSSLLSLLGVFGVCANRDKLHSQSAHADYGAVAMS